MLAGCGSASSGPSITLYSGQHEQTTDGLVTAFEQQTGITVNVRNDDEDTLANLIALQGSHSPADVFYTENSPPLEFLQEKGLLAPVDSSTLARYAAKYNSPQGDWVGVSARVSVIVYDPSLIPASQLPTSVMQLASPKYQGKLAFAPSETDFQPIVTSVMRPTARPPRSPGSRASSPTPPAISSRTTRRSSMRSTAARSPSVSSTSITGTGSKPRSAPPRCTRRSPTSPRTTPAT